MTEVPRTPYGNTSGRYTTENGIYSPSAEPIAYLADFVHGDFRDETIWGVDTDALDQFVWGANNGPENAFPAHTISEKYLYTADINDFQRIAQFDLTTGAFVQTASVTSGASVGQEVEAMAPVLGSPDIYALCTKDGGPGRAVHRIDATDLSVVWAGEVISTDPTSDQFTPNQQGLCTTTEALWACSPSTTEDNGRFVKIDSTDGSVLERDLVTDWMSNIRADSDGDLILCNEGTVSSTDYRIFKFDAVAASKVWERADLGVLSYLIITEDGDVLVASPGSDNVFRPDADERNTLYKLDGEDGSLIWAQAGFTELAADFGMAYIDDGTVIVNDGDDFAQVDTDGTILQTVGAHGGAADTIYPTGSQLRT